MKRKRRDSRIMVRVTEAERKALYDLAVIRDVPASWLIRESIKNTLSAAGETTR